MLTTLGRIEEASDSKGVPNWLETHPQPEDRVQRVQAAVRDAETGAQKFTTDRNGYLQKMKGLVWGDSPDQGIVRGSRFLHKGLRFDFEFPTGWTIQNGQTQVAAKEPNGKSVMVLEQIRRPLGRTIDDTAIITMQNAGFRQVDGGPTTINGLQAFLGTWVGALQNFGRVQVRALFVRNTSGANPAVYFVAGIAPIDAYPNVSTAFTKSLESFRSMSPADAERLQPNRIDLYTARRRHVARVSPSAKARHHQADHPRDHERPSGQRPAAAR
jgi:predicted Zn-dependent protease